MQTHRLIAITIVCNILGFGLMFYNHSKLMHAYQEMGELTLELMSDVSRLTTVVMTQQQQMERLIRVVAGDDDLGALVESIRMREDVVIHTQPDPQVRVTGNLWYPQMHQTPHGSWVVHQGGAWSPDCHEIVQPNQVIARAPQTPETIMGQVNLERVVWVNGEARCPAGTLITLAGSTHSGVHCMRQP